MPGCVLAAASAEAHVRRLGVCVQLGDDALEGLVGLLRVSELPAKGELQRVFFNLAAHTETRRALLRLLLATLRAPLYAGERSPGAVQAAPESLAEALKV
jgi:hypothetical protein